MGDLMVTWEGSQSPVCCLVLQLLLIISCMVRQLLRCFVFNMIGSLLGSN